MKHLVALIILISSTLLAGAPACSGCLHVFINFLQFNSLNKAIVYHCYSKSEQARTVAALSRAGVFVKLVHVKTSSHHSEAFFDYKQRIGVFADFDCENTTDAIKSGMEHDETYPGMFSQVTWWSVFTRRAGAGDALLALRSLPLSLNSQLLLFVKEKDSQYAYDVYSMDYRKSSPLNITFYAVYSDPAGDELEAAQEYMHEYLSPLVLERENYTAEELQRRYEEMRRDVGRTLRIGSGRGRGRAVSLVPKVRRRHSMHNITLSGAYVLTDKPRHLTDRAYIFSERDLHLDTPTRYNMLLLKYMQLMYLFNLNLIRAEQWGEQRNGSWVGIVGALQRGEIDFGVSAMSIKKPRLEAIEYGGVVCNIIFPTLFRQPETRSSVSLSAFTAPLEAAAWAVALPLSLLAAGLLAFTAQLETRYMGSPDNFTFNLGSLLLDFVNIFYLDASWRESRMWAGRATVFTACMLGLLLMQFYSASLLATVLAPPPKPINSLQDLLRTDMQYKVEDIVYHHQFFNEYMEIPEIKQLYTTKIIQGKIPPFITNNEGLKLVKKGNFAFQCTASSAYHELSRWSDDLVCSVDKLMVYQEVQLLQNVARGSPYNQHMLVALAMMRERGLVARTKPRYYRPRPRCPPEHASTPRPVAIVQFLPALRMLGSLCAVSIGVLVAELIISRICLARAQIN